MPIYEYRCPDCSRVFEKIIWNSKKEVISCPYCQGEKACRILSSFSTSGGQPGKAGQGLSSGCGPSSSRFS